MDFARPVALMLLGVLGTFAEDERARSIVDSLMAAVPSGNYLVIEDGTKTVQPGAAADDERVRDQSGYDYELRSPERIARFSDGLELLEPGVVSVSRWRPEQNPFGEPQAVDAFCGVARKP